MSIQAVLHIKELVKETLREAFRQADYGNLQKLRTYFREFRSEGHKKLEFEVPVDFIKFLEAFFMEQFKLKNGLDMGEQLEAKLDEMDKEHIDELRNLLKIGLKKYLKKKKNKLTAFKNS